MPMPLQQAVAIRRAAFMAAVLGATLTAHAVSGGEVAVARTSPVAWALLILGAALTGRPGTRMRPRGRTGTLVLLTLGQAALHVVICLAPWTVGLASHMHDGLLASPALGAHAVAALLLGVLLARLDAILDAAMRAVAAVRRRLLTPRQSAADLRLPARALRSLRLAAGIATSRAARGPPLLLTT